jgi:membrane-associated phospholipid phosphatase
MDGLPLRSRPRSGVSAALTVTGLAALVFVALLAAVLATWSPLESFDHTVDVRLGHLVAGHPDAVTVIKAVTDLGSAPVRWAILLAAAILLTVRRRWAAAVVLPVAGAGALLGLAAKSLVNRPRPVLAHPVAHAAGAGFPSGHALGSLVCYGALALVLLPMTRGRWRPALVTVAVAGLVCIGASRLLLGVHFVSDVVAGWALGTVWLGIVWLIMTRAATSGHAPTWLRTTWPAATRPAGRSAAGNRQSVDGYGAGRTADQRVDVQRGQPVAELGGQRGQRGHRPDDRVQAGLRPAPEPVQQRRNPQLGH